MIRILPKTLWILAAISTVFTSEISAYCARCVKIEEERAKEQAEHPQTVGYYDDQKSKSDRSSQPQSPPEEEKKVLSGSHLSAHKREGTSQSHSKTAASAKEFSYKTTDQSDQSVNF